MKYRDSSGRSNRVSNKFMFHDFKPEIKLFLLVALIAVAISVGGIFLLRGLSQAPISPTPPVIQQTPPPAPQPQVLDTSDFTLSEVEGWQTYRSDTQGTIIEGLGFEVKYPEGFELENNERDYDLTISRGSEYSPPWNFVTVFDPMSVRKSEIPSQSYLTWRDQFSVAFVKTGQTAKEFAEYVYKYNQDYPLNVRDFKETNIGNYKAYTFQCDSHCSGIPWKGSLSFGSPHKVVYLQNGKFVFVLVVVEKPIFNQILSTFRFVE